jgi:hypothetical protein
MVIPMDWLLQSEPWVQYRTFLDLLKCRLDDGKVEQARQSMVKHPQVQQLLSELTAWPGSVLTSHKSAGHLIHKLTFIADLGLQADDPLVAEVVTRVMEHRAKTGPFQVLMSIPTHPDGIDGIATDQWAWALCDAPLAVYALVKFGLESHPHVQMAVEYLANLIRANGWPCAVSLEFGKFRGPGRKDDPCPYANLVMLKVLAQLPQWRNSAAAHTGVETLLTVWQERQERHPYQFYMGTDFCKLKAPLVWYDLLHVLDVLSQFSWARHDPRLQSMLRLMSDKADEQGRFTPESIWTAWKDWEFGQKKVPSAWLTLLAQRVLTRAAA